MNFTAFASSRLRFAAVTFAALAALQLGGCANVTLPAATGSAGNVEKLKTVAATPMGVGEFTASGKALSADKSISVRGANSVAPTSGSFAQQLRDQLTAELKASGLLDAASNTVVTGVLIENSLDAGMSTGTGKLGARFQVTRAGKMVFDKEIVATSTWESSFMGAVAIPAAINQYGALYQKLVGQLLDDTEFLAAIKR
jgi:hypothetical protein